MHEQRGLARTVVGDGIPLLITTAGILVLAGGFAMFLALTGEFLPHDLRLLVLGLALSFPAPDSPRVSRQASADQDRRS